MTKTATAADARHMTSTRQGASKGLLARKARESAAASMQEGGTLEALFPPAEGGEQASDTAPAAAAVPAVEYIESSAAGGDAPAPLVTPEHAASPSAPLAASTPAAWSEEDERAFQELSARRKAAGFQRRGRDVGAQRLSVGTLTPNPRTVTATIVELVAGKGSVTRAELLDLMAAATFPHPKAKPADRAWCQGWVAGAVRDKFLTVQADAAEEVFR